MQSPILYITRHSFSSIPKLFSSIPKQLSNNPHEWCGIGKPECEVRDIFFSHGQTLIFYRPTRWQRRQHIRLSTSSEDLVELFTTIGKVERAEIQYEPNGRIESHQPSLAEAISELAEKRDPATSQVTDSTVTSSTSRRLRLSRLLSVLGIRSRSSTPWPSCEIHARGWRSDRKSVQEALRYHDSYEVTAAMIVARDKIRRSQEMTKIAMRLNTEPMRLNPGAAEFHPGQQSGRQGSSGTQGQQSCCGTATGLLAS